MGKARWRKEIKRKDNKERERRAGLDWEMKGEKKKEKKEGKKKSEEKLGLELVGDLGLLVFRV